MPSRKPPSPLLTEETKAGHQPPEAQPEQNRKPNKDERGDRDIGNASKGVMIGLTFRAARHLVLLASKVDGSGR